MKEIKKVLLIINPISGNSQKESLIKIIKDELQSKDILLELYKTTGKQDQERIRKLLDENNFDRVFIAGGDGTIKLVAAALNHTDIPVAIFPAGSANGLALNLGLPDERREQVKVALGSRITRMDMLEINGEICLHISDLGLNAELIKNYEHSPIRGKIGYLLQSIPTLWKSKYPFEFEIEYEKERFTKKGILLAFANAKKFGTGANINPRGKIDDGVFELLIFKSLDLLEILKTLRNETRINSEFVEILPLKQAKVYNKNAVALQVDGEYIGEKKEISVRIHPRKLSIMVKENP